MYVISYLFCSSICSFVLLRLPLPFGLLGVVPVSAACLVVLADLRWRSWAHLASFERLDRRTSPTSLLFLELEVLNRYRLGYR